jgi:hypothetical protein
MGNDMTVSEESGPVKELGIGEAIAALRADLARAQTDGVLSDTVADHL